MASADPFVEYFPDCWDPHYWTDTCRAVFLERLGPDDDRDQELHEWLGMMSTFALIGWWINDRWWAKREKKQLPSKTGAGDPIRDLMHFRKGQGRIAEYAALLAAARRRWPDFPA